MSREERTLSRSQLETNKYSALTVKRAAQSHTVWLFARDRWEAAPA